MKIASIIAALIVSFIVGVLYERVKWYQLLKERNEKRGSIRAKYAQGLVPSRLTDV